ncbi:hypothetical protein [Hyphobacterium marinum]|uniref:Uncharacterized protein n=1 Tax=Hyphobacterium marinum TaxID=3116574 RepID=A0ABU7LVX9_9PROT|nr:hypothetical protein [Hyphobacterium sp. Y6023]MEE2565636.1 hypothetical protein [Hyphobacterium sp. Y6023]
MKHIITGLAAGAALLAAGIADGSVPPPPPPPPDGLPESYDGYSTETLWYAYLNWVRGETVARRESAFEALRLPGYSQDQTAWRTELDGPGYAAISWWIPHGTLFAFEQVCPVSAGYTNPQGCLWRYRSAHFAAQAQDIHAIAYDTFDGAAFAARLAGQGITPDTLTRDYRSDFGLADTVHARLDAMIVTREVREDACPGVAEGVAAIAEISLPLSAEGPPAGTPPPPPPAPPSGDMQTLTIPVGYFPDMDVTVTIESNGAGSMSQLLAQLTGPVRACIDSASE